MSLYIVGLLIANLYSKSILPSNSGGTPIIKPTLYPILYNGMVIIPITDTVALHIHHWLLYLLICLMSLFFYVPSLILGFSFGLFIQGITTYKDRFKFICENPY